MFTACVFSHPILCYLQVVFPVFLSSSLSTSNFDLQIRLNFWNMNRKYERLGRKENFDYVFPEVTSASILLTNSMALCSANHFVRRHDFPARLPRHSITIPSSSCCMHFLKKKKKTSCFSAWLLNSWPCPKLFNSLIYEKINFLFFLHTQKI